MNKPMMCSYSKEEKSVLTIWCSHGAAYNDQSIANSAQREKNDQLDKKNTLDKDS